MDLFNSIHVNENKSIIMITHDMDIVNRYAKRVVVLKDGVIVFDGKKEDLFTHKDFSSFHLDYPTPLKMMNYLVEKLGIPYKTVFTKEELLNHLKEVNKWILK